MKKRTLFIIPLAIAAFGVSAVGFVAASATNDPGITLQDKYDYNSEFTVPELVKDGVTYSHVFLYPDGTATAESTVLLNQTGTYEIRYSAAKDGKYFSENYSFIVENQNYYFSGTSSLASYECSDRTYGYEGLYVCLAENETLTFTQPITLSNATKDQNIFNLFVAPEIVGTMDFGQLNFVLTDVKDPSCYLRFRAKASGEGINAPYTYWLAGGNDQDMVGREGTSNIHVNNDFGSPVVHSFYGYYPSTQPSTIGKSCLNVSYNSDDNCVYAANGTYFISDLDSAKYYSSIWDGFTSGQAILSITASSYSSTYARFLIKDVMDVDLSTPVYTDTTGPEITVETGYDTLPVALVGHQYPVFDATAEDDVSGAASVTSHVYYDHDGTLINVSVSDGYFDVNREGTYHIVYESKDSVGNISSKILDVTAVDEERPITISPSSRIVKSVKRGVPYTFPQFRVSGGSGQYTASFDVKLGEESIDCGIDSFIPSQLGTYTITYIVHDITLQEATYTYQLVSEYNDGAVFYDEPQLPKYLISDYSFTLPELYATDFANKDGEQVLADVEVSYNGNVTTYKSGQSFIPAVDNNLDEIGITYKYGDASYSYSIPCVKTFYGRDMDIRNYFLGSGYTMDVTSYGTQSEFISNGTGTTSWEFANAVAAEGFSLTLGTSASKTDYTSMQIVFEDKFDSSKTVTATLASTSRGTVNFTVGSKTLRTDLVFQSDNTLVIKYSKGYLYLGGMSIAVKNFDDGTAFTGFPNDFVYVSFSTKGGKAGSSYYLQKFDNQTICETSFDFIEPRVTIVDDYGGYHPLGSTVTAPSILVSDVLDPSVTSSVSAYDPNRDFIVSTDGVSLNGVATDRGYDFTLDSYGVYTVSYKASDSTGNEVTFAFSVGVLDEVAPEINLTSGYTTSCSVGDSIIIPNYTVSDNTDAPEDITTYVSIVTPNERHYTLSSGQNSFKTASSGVYTVTIYAYDTNGNMASLSYTVNVK